MTKKTENKAQGWWVSNSKNKLRFGDRRIAKKGVTHKVSTKKELVPGAYGLHASPTILDAYCSLGQFTNLQGNLWRVETSSPTYPESRYVNSNDDQTIFCAYERTYTEKYTNPLPSIRNFLLKEAHILLEDEGTDMPDALVDYLLDPKADKHSKLNKVLKAHYQSDRSYNTRRWSSNSYYGYHKLITATFSCIPERNLESMPGTNYLWALFNEIASEQAPRVDDNEQISHTEVKAILKKLIKTPRTKMDKLIVEGLMRNDYGIRDAADNYNSTVRKEAVAKEKQKLENKMLKVIS